MGKNLITGLIQICIVSNQFEETVQNLAQRFGIGPWKYWHYTPPTIFDTRRDGKPVPWTKMLGVAWVGGIQLEVIQPLTGPTIYEDFIERHGEGVQHLLVETGPSYFDAIRAFEQAGYVTSQSARFNPPMQVGPLTVPPLPAFLARSLALQYVYHDTDAALGVALETVRMPPGISFRLGVRLGKPEFVVEPGEAPAKVSSFESVGILTEDLDQTLRHWTWAGIDPWQDVPAENARIATAGFGPVHIELVEPREDGVYRRLLDTHGPGVRYLGVRGALEEAFLAAGCSVLEKNSQGTFVDARPFAHTVFRM